MNSSSIKDKHAVYGSSIAFQVKEMRFFVVLCVIAALAAPSLGEYAAALASQTREATLPEPEAQNNEETATAEVNAEAAPAPAPQPAETPENEAASANENNPGPETPPKIAELQIDPTPAPGEEPIVVEIPHETRPFSSFLHSLYDRFPFHLPDFHLPSLWPFRRGMPPRGRFPPRDYPDVYIVRESEPDYY